MDRFVVESLFMTITNANFDAGRFVVRIKEAQMIHKKVEEIFLSYEGRLSDIPFRVRPTSYQNKEEMLAAAHNVGVLSTKNEDVRSLRELLIYGVKGVASYTDHACRLKYEDMGICHFISEALDATTREDMEEVELLNLVMECGNVAVKSMAILDKAHCESYGDPLITKVKLGTRNNPGILISGHDMLDLEELLKQTEGTGVDVYTHGEMLPGHYYPEFRKYEHFVGNYGNSWWKQGEEFEKFNGPILFTTNCIVPPKKGAGYVGRTYMTGSAGFEGFKHVADRRDGKPKNFKPLIEHAKKCPPPTEIEQGEIVGGFAHHQVAKLSQKVLDAVKSGEIQKFVVMAGCDGRMKNREYYTDFAKALPKDTVILTAGCAKYRYNKLQLDDINGIPRVLDAGQCNDSYSLVLTAIKLKELLKCKTLNELPIVYNIAWYEQKAVAVFLALLSLGIQEVHVGPTLPAFLSPKVLALLQEKFGVKTISTVENDMLLFGIKELHMS